MKYKDIEAIKDFIRQKSRAFCPRFLWALSIPEIFEKLRNFQDKNVDMKIFLCYNYFDAEKKRRIKKSFVFF